jgi:hypothetical protein
MSTQRFSPPEVKEINNVIAAIEKVLAENKKTSFEIGARDKTILSTLLKTNQISSKSLFHFACKRTHANTILLHFTKTKEMKKHNFSTGAQNSIYLIA